MLRPFDCFATASGVSFIALFTHNKRKMNLMKITHLALLLTLGTVTACGGGSSSGGGSSGGGSSDDSFTNNLSGKWTGMLDEVHHEMTIDHDAGSSTGTGTITRSINGTTSGGPISLVKNGNEVTIVEPTTSSTGCDGTYSLTLTSPDTAEGYFELGLCGYSTNTTITRIYE